MGKELTPEQIAEAEKLAEAKAAEEAADKALNEKVDAAVSAKLDEAIKAAVAPLHKTIEHLKAGTPENTAIAKPEKREPYSPIVVKDVKWEKTEKGQKKSGKGDFQILVPSLKIDGVLYTAVELSKDAEMCSKLASAGSSYLKPYFAKK